VHDVNHPDRRSMCPGGGASHLGSQVPFQGPMACKSMGRPPPSPQSSPDSRRRHAPPSAPWKSNSFNGHLEPAAQRNLIASGSFRVASKPAAPVLDVGEVKYLERCDDRLSASFPRPLCNLVKFGWILSHCVILGRFAGRYKVFFPLTAKFPLRRFPHIGLLGSITTVPQVSRTISPI
jgi:hypothetical protein